MFSSQCTTAAFVETWSAFQSSRERKKNIHRERNRERERGGGDFTVMQQCFLSKKYCFGEVMSGPKQSCTDSAISARQVHSFNVAFLTR